MQRERVARTWIAWLLLTTLVAAWLVAPNRARGGLERKIVFVRYEQDRSNLFAINSDGDGLTRLTDVEAWESDAALSPDGSEVVFTRCRQSCNIFVANVDGSGATRLTSGPELEQFPVWSPDGSKVAFSRGGDPDSGASLSIMDADGTDQTALTSDRYFNAFPTWSPDGSQLVFVRFLLGDYELFRIGADGTERVRLTDNEGVDLWPQWSPDGSRIAYSHQPQGNQDYEVVTMDPDGSGREALTTNRFKDDMVPIWAPLDNRIAFVRCQGTTCHLFAKNQDGSGRVKLVDGGVESLSFAWTADGAELALARLTKHDRFDVFTVGPDGNNLTNLTRTQSKDESAVDW